MPSRAVVPTSRSRDDLARDVPDVGRTWEHLQRDLATRVVTPTLVHGDFCAPNAYVSETADGPRVTGVGDFSPHTLQADPLMDVTGAVAFLELEHYVDAVEDARWLEEQAVQRWGADVRHWIEVYRRFYGFYFSSAHVFDETLYAWCRAQLRPLP